MSSPLASHPVWVRGLKQSVVSYFLVLFKVAPCVGAWIETLLTSKTSASSTVAPCVGAWIETLKKFLEPLQSDVAPCVGAWIETKVLTQAILRDIVSHPVWVRGLKLL